MKTLTLSPAGRPYLAEQATKNGTFIHLLRDANGDVHCMVNISIEQCDQAISVRVEIGDSCHSTTLPRGDDAGERIARFVEFIANGEQDYGLVDADDDLAGILHTAIRLGFGDFLLDADLELTLKVWNATPRPGFRFEMRGEWLTLPLQLPADSQRAYELLRSYAQDLISNYRSGAAA